MYGDGDTRLGTMEYERQRGAAFQISICWICSPLIPGTLISRRRQPDRPTRRNTHRENHVPRRKSRSADSSSPQDYGGNRGSPRPDRRQKLLARCSLPDLYENKLDSYRRKSGPMCPTRLNERISRARLACVFEAEWCPIFKKRMLSIRSNAARQGCRIGGRAHSVLFTLRLNGEDLCNRVLRSESDKSVTSHILELRLGPFFAENTKIGSITVGKSAKDSLNTQYQTPKSFDLRNSIRENERFAPPLRIGRQEFGVSSQSRDGEESPKVGSSAVIATQKGPADS